ncbi:TPA: type II toxin-antitoxin system RelE/ParE family toxin [Campylobacter jejuni]|nr:type II toxin-antitoxin system RelE/ParE family toxin [Campylobacter jejuni]HDZ4938440.1 type II toxin-antitoxin system RelE/ParE family toxin [Campylobacter jejuni]HDZ4941790.1 type II toxin-antitoxin system RelE/ParE family toxin [Campylobacter jejuni]HDZ4947192.1 type II toxin-antitoxin system RelE/ParE family toxin [Campylobacter jejuni]HDZ4948389.1 type II toxin-antitoxin system RelE/ParE family toxin [Campylobacter jejuni]
MKIVPTPKFKNGLRYIVNFIKLDSSFYAKEFNSICKNLSFMPYKNRKSLSFDNENIRDLIFKGYIIPYLIDKSKNEIVILGIYKSNLWD